MNTHAMSRVCVAVGVIAASLFAVVAPAGAAAQAWTLVGTGAGASYGNLAAVSCPTASTCFAVGTLDAPNAHTRLVERWNGAKWSVVAVPNPSGATTSQLSAVQCTSTTNCVAVGQYTTPALVTKTLVLRWDGKHWTLPASPNPAGVGVSVLSGVQCTSATNCIAVGGQFVSSLTMSSELTLVEQWNGSTWSIVPSPNPAIAGDSNLAGVACTSSTSCFAVGSYSTDIVTNTLIEQWDGATWSIAASPNPGNSGSNELFGVTCKSATLCFAVGSGHGSLVERWDGSTWSLSASANPTGSTGVSLTSVSCPSFSRCYAVGDVFRKTAVQRFVETWNGTGWGIVGVPIPSGTKQSSLSGVSCATTTNCFAVGDFRLGPSRRPLFERYS